jgi:hypothetical protein
MRISSEVADTVPLVSQFTGIDAEYTRPGVEALLEKFGETAKMAQDHYEFDWRP